MEKCMSVTLSSSGVIHTFMWFTWAIFVSLAAQRVVRDGSSLSMEQSAKFPLPLMAPCTKAPTSTFTDPPAQTGYCGGIAAGKVRVGFSVGNCGVPFNTNGDAYTGSNQANRVIIEEVEPPVG